MYTSYSLRPGRRRSGMTLLTSLMSTLMLVMTITMPRAHAQHEGLHPFQLFDALAERGEIHIDTRPHPLHRRQSDLEDGTSTTDASTTTATSAAPTDSELSSATGTSTVSVTEESGSPTITAASNPSVTVVTEPLPSPFDGSLGSNFTAPSCPEFFTKFLSNDTFRNCVPVSLMLQNSQSFFQAQQNAALLDATLATACNAPVDKCTQIMYDIAKQLVDNKNCGADFATRQPLVIQAYNGLVAYEPLYRATCLKMSSHESSSSEWCFASALGNASANPADYYPYYTALGMGLPDAARPSCTTCLEQMMEIFAKFAVQEAQPLANTYLGCAQKVDLSCGASFADTAVKVGSVDSDLQGSGTGGDKANAAVMSKNPSQWALMAGVGIVVLLSTL